MSESMIYLLCSLKTVQCSWCVHTTKCTIFMLWQALVCSCQTVLFSLLYSRLLVLFPCNVYIRQYYFSTLFTSDNTMSVLCSHQNVSFLCSFIVIVCLSQRHVCVVFTSDRAISLLYSRPISLVPSSQCWRQTVEGIWCVLSWLS